MNTDYAKVVIEHSKVISDTVESLENSYNLMEEFMQGLQTVMKGYEIAKRIINVDPYVHYFIMQKHIGDVMRMLKQVILFKNYYSEDNQYHCAKDCGTTLPKNVVCKKLIIITTEHLAGVARLYSSIDDVIILPKVELNDLSIYSNSSMCCHRNLHRDEYGLQGEVKDHPKSTMFGIGSYNWVLNLPMNLPQKDEIIKGSICVSENSLREARKILDLQGAVADYTIIICPYAKSTSMLEEADWMPFLEYLTRKRFLIFTNVGKNEKELLGTIRLQCSVDVYAALGMLGCAIIGVQSGIVDVIRWMQNDTRLIDIAVLLKPIDLKCANNRNVRAHIERKNNTIHLLIEKEEICHSADKLINQFLFWEKGNWQKNCFLCISKNELLYSLTSVNDYFQLLTKMEHIIIFLSVRGTVHHYWNLFEGAGWLGLNSNLSEGANVSYIAVVDKAESFIYEKMGKDFSEIKYQAQFKDERPIAVDGEEWVEDNYYYLTSHAWGKWNYTKAAIVINGQQYAQNKNGLNIVIYDKNVGYVIDSIYVDLEEDENLLVRR